MSHPFDVLMPEVMARADRFGHRQHIHLTWLAVRRYGTGAAITLVSDGIRRTARYAGAPQKYHATVSRAWATSGPGQSDAIRAALKVTVDGQPLFRSVQATWNVLEQSAGPALVEAHDAGCTVIVKEALANGRLAQWDAYALAAALRQPWATIVLSGAATTAQLDSNLRALTTTVDSDRLPAIAEPPEQYWQKRASLPWT